MKKIITFLYTKDTKKTKKYLYILQKKLKDFDIRTFEQLSKDEFKKCEVAIIFNTTKEQLECFSSLIWVQSVRAGIENILMHLKHSKVQISRLVDKQIAYTMSNSVLAWVYYIQKNMYTYKLQQNNSIWNEIDEKENKDTNIAILGLGKLGMASANKLLQNDFKISAWARSKKDVQNIKMYYGDDGLNEILKHADIVVCLLPLSDETTNLISKEKIKDMKEGSSFINFARGPIVDYEALEQSLHNGQIKHAVLDVFDIEPLEKNSSLWNNKNINILPHIAAVTNIKTASKIIANKIIRYYADEKIPLFIDKKLGY